MIFLNYLMYALFSVLEYLAMFYLMCQLFRFNVNFREKIKHILLASSLTNIDYLLKFQTDFGYYSIPIQIIFMITFIWSVNKINLYHSMILTTVGFTAYLHIQIIYMHVLSYLNLYGISDGQTPTNYETIRLQLICITTSYLISWIFIKKGFGFSFLDQNTYTYTRYRGINKYFIVTILISILTLTSISYSFWNMNQSLFTIFSVTLFIFFWISIFLSFKKEQV